MTAPRAREQADPPSPPDRRPPRRGTGSSPSIYAASAAGRRVPPVARRGLVRCARALAAAALLALTGALFLPPTAEAQTATTLISNTGQGDTATHNYGGTFSQRFTTGSNEDGYTLTGVDVVSASSTGFTAQVCGVDSDLEPTSTCTDLTAPGTFAVGTMSFTAPTNTTLVKETTYAVVVTALATNTPGPDDLWSGVAQGWELTFSNRVDANPAAGWSIASTGHWKERDPPGSWRTHVAELRIAIKGSAAGGGTPTCTLNTGDLWCGVVTVGAITTGGSVAAHGFAGADGGLDDKTFSVGTNNYTIDGLYVGTAGDLNLDLTGALDAADKGNLKLVVGSTDFDLDDATHVSSENAYLWTGTGLNWSSDTHVTLRLRRAVALSTDATLSGLTVYDGSSNLTLSPSFASGTETYTASAAYDIATVTVTANKNQADATIAWLDASDATLVDADAMAPGRQVALAAGGNTFKVKVTAEDGTTTKTYTVTVNRASPTCTLNTGDLWCGVVTVGNGAGFDGYAASVSLGALSDRTFLVGTNNYTIDAIYVEIGGFNPERLTFNLASGLTSADQAALVLHLGSVEFEFSDANVAAGLSYKWSDTGLDWSSESFVTLRLRDTPVTNNAPVFSPTTATREVEENSAAGTSVGAVIPEATDSDSGDTLTYSMEGTDAASFAFDASTRQITTITGVTYNHEATKNSYSVTVKASDGTASATIAVTIDVTDVNEKSAKPDKPTLAKVTGSSNTLVASWTKPGLNGGPEITGYDVQYKVSTDSSWTAFAHTGEAVATTITGLTADTSYQVRVRAKNGETDSDWSDASDAVKTNAAAVAPTISAVAVTSTPVLETDTYGAGETIEVSVTFDEVVNATSDTDFVLSVAGAKRAPLVRGSGTATLVFGYTVVPGDEDDNGIWIGDQDRTLVGNRDGDPQNGTITSVATSTAADLTHAELGQQSGHKVDGSRSIVSVAVSSTPMLETDTYGAGETIRFTVTFNVAVDVSGDPVLTFALGNQGQVRDVDAAHEGGGGSTALVFAYTVVSTDEDNNGIFLRDEDDFNNPDGPVRLDSDDTIRFAGTSTDVPLYWQGRGTQSGHKVDGSRTTGNNAPVFTSSASVSVEENTTNATVVAVDNDTDDDITGYAITGGTDEGFFSEVTSAGVLSFDEAPNFEDPKDSDTDNTYEVTVEATSGTGTREMTATQTITVTVTDADEKSAKPDKPTLAKVTGSSTSLTATWAEPDLDGGPDIAGYDLQYREGTTGTWEDFAHTGTAVTTTVTGLTADTSYQVQVRAKNGETDSDWSDPSDAVKTNAEMATTCTLNTDDIWCGVVTVGQFQRPPFLLDGFGEGEGDLSDTEFTYGTNSYTIDIAATELNNTALFFSLTSALTAGDRAALELHVDGNASFAFSAANHNSSDHTYSWRDTGLNWFGTPAVTLRLRAATETDATLSALSVTHAGEDVALHPAFAPGQLAYRVLVANPVNEVTVAATATVAAAEVAYLDASDMAIPDTDTMTPGREVALEVGATVVEVKVTAEDGTTMRTYRVTVTRRAVDAAGAEGELRLSDEKPYSETANDRYGGTAGRVVVSHAGAWGTVCSDGIRDSKKDKTFSTFDYDANGDVILDADGNPQQFDKVNEAAALICKAMDYDDGEYQEKYSEFLPGAAEAVHQVADYWPPGSSYPAGGPTPIWLDDLRCVAGESALGTDPLPGAMSHCSYAGWGLHNCTHKEDAVVRCWNNDAAGPGLKSLQGRFVSPPERHDGTNRVKVRVAFSEPVEESPENVGAHGVEVEGGEVTSVSPVGGDARDGAGTRSAGGRNAGGEDREVVWEFEIEPDSDGDLTVTLEAGRPCGEPGAICTADGRALSEGISTTVEGPEAPPPLTASFEDMPAAHDGAGAFRFRVAFSENIGISYRSLREDAFTVSGGRVTRGKRVDDRRDLFEMTVEPDGDGEVTVTLPAGRECSVSGAICTKGENRRQLTNAPTATVAGPAVETGPAGLTARFARVPSEHDGETAFKFRIAFSEEIRMSGRRLRSDVVAVSGGRATKAGRVNKRKDLWKLKVRPDSLADVTVTLSSGAACDSPGAVCTADGRALSNTISATVKGPVAVSVADARAREGEDETIDFAVSLSRAASGRVSVTYATADGTATAGSDYTRASGKLRFAPGETEKRVRVPVLDDVVDEGEETFTLRLLNASGAVVADGEATGTIVNSDPLQKMWLSRFGRTVAGQVVDAVTGRLSGSSGGSQVTLGGQSIDLSAQSAGTGEARRTLAKARPPSHLIECGQNPRISPRSICARSPGAARAANDDDPPAGSGSWEAARAGSWEDPAAGHGSARAGSWEDPAAGHGSARAGSWADLEAGHGSARSGSWEDPETDHGLARTLTGRELLLGSSFHLTTSGGEAGGPGYAAWGRMSVDGFDGEAPADGGTMRLDGEVTTGLLGADAQWERWLAGVALSVSSAEGTFDQPGVDSGTVESTLTSVNPYVRYEASDRLSVWGLVGYGTGDMTIRGNSPVRTDLMMRLGAAGARGVLLEAGETGGIDLALRGDAFLVQMDWEKVSNETDTRADASRLRLVLEAGRSFTLGEGAVLAPALELGLRHDGGDAETGTGVEVGGRIRYTDAGSGLTVEANARTLIAHEDSGYREWGAGGSVRLGPDASGRGLSLALAPVWGTPSSGVDRLWSARDAAGLAPGGKFEAERRLEAELGYGLGAFGGHGVVTPYAGLGLAEAGDRTWRAGARWSLAPHLAMSLDGTRREPANDNAPEHAGQFRLILRW